MSDKYDEMALGWLRIGHRDTLESDEEIAPHLAALLRSVGEERDALAAECKEMHEILDRSKMQNCDVIVRAGSHGVNGDGRLGDALFYANKHGVACNLDGYTIVPSETYSEKR